MSEYSKTGYLDNEYKFFYICDKKEREYKLHYHDFHKLLIFLGGNVDYYIEGKYYTLTPGDIILIPAGRIHRPLVSLNAPYERIIVYISDEFFKKSEFVKLRHCYEYTLTSGNNMIKPDRTYQGLLLMDCINKLKSARNFNEDYGKLYEKNQLINLLIQLNVFIKNGNIPDTGHISNEKIQNIITYINEHLTDNLDIETIASAAFLNSSYLMHLFKDETGISVMQYITRKRLFLADSLLKSGHSKTEAAFASGFANYAAYYHARKTIE